jgi:hypothetical protein
MNFVEVHRYNSQNKAHEKRVQKYKQRGFGTCLINRDHLPFPSACLYSSSSSSSSSSFSSSFNGLQNNSQSVHTAKSLAKILFNNNVNNNTYINTDDDNFSNLSEKIPVIYDTPYMPYGEGIGVDEVKESLETFKQKSLAKFLLNTGAAEQDFVPFFVFGDSLEEILQTPLEFQS